MNKPINLSPSIEDIERRLIGVNEGLIQAVVCGETSPAIANAVRRSPEWAQYQADLAQDRDAVPASVAARPPPAMPAHLLDLIRRRVAAHSLASSPIPVPGQIVRVEAIVTPRSGQLDAVLMAPLHVLLDAPAEAEVIWHGWLVAGETDYAGWWDFVLQDQDAPFDPEAAMVQLWNPVRLYLPQAARVVGSFSPTRLQAVRSLAGDFATGEPPTEISPWPSRVASRATSAGFRVVTGSPLGGEADLRHRYQQIYFEAAEAVREPARLALRELALIPAGQAGSLLNRLIAAAGRLAQVLVPEPRVAVAMSGDTATDTPDLSWPDVARLRLIELHQAGDGSLQVTATGSEPVTAEIRKGTLVEEHFVIVPGTSATVTWDRGSSALVLETPSGRRLELGLADGP
jgi:hypothetical protein